MAPRAHDWAVRNMSEDGTGELGPRNPTAGAQACRRGGQVISFLSAARVVLRMTRTTSSAQSGSPRHGLATLVNQSNLTSRTISTRKSRTEPPLYPRRSAAAIVGASYPPGDARMTIKRSPMSRSTKT